MRRRQFIVLLGGTATAWSLGVRAQQSALPVIGVLSSASLTGQVSTRFREGLKAGGFVEGQNVKIEFHRAGGHYDQLPVLATEMVRRRVRLIVATGGLVSAMAAKAATTTIPILFVSGFDPVKMGLVASYNRPGGNATGVSVYTTELVAKRLELLRELVPSATSIAVLVNQNNAFADVETKDILEAVAQAAGLHLLVLKAGTESEIEAAFASAVQQRADALFVSGDPFFTTRRPLIVALAARHALPAAYPWREYAEVGGLMSYGPNIQDSYYQVGLYAGRILKGEKPAELPVHLPTKFELVINRMTANALGITPSRLMLLRMDKLIP